MRTLVALQDFPYAGGRLQLKAGDRFEPVSDEDARILKGVGKARDDKSLLQTKVVTSSEREVGSPAAADDGQRRRGRYRRSDMRSED